MSTYTKSIEVADWLESEAKSFEEMAAQYRLTAGLLRSPQSILPSRSTTQPLASKPKGSDSNSTQEEDSQPPKIAGGITAEAFVRFLLNGGGGRVKHIARHFNVAEKEVEKIIDDPVNEIVVAPRGWIKHRSQIKEGGADM